MVLIQAFKLIVNDPDSVLNPLIREVREVGPGGKEVIIVLKGFLLYWNFD